jgi:AraC family transcriptional regulator
MIPEPKIIVAPPRIMAGLCIQTTLADNRTFELWSRFMPLLKQLENRVGEELCSIRRYPDGFVMATFTPESPYLEWAAVEVVSTVQLPAGFEVLELRGGTYAVFTFTGLAEDFPAFARQLYVNWLPGSGYLPDDREHLAIMDSRYRPGDPASEEDIWIPVK